MSEDRVIVEDNLDGPGKTGGNHGPKRAKFREIGESRTNKAIDAISRIGNLSNRSNYEWDEAEVRKIIKALKDAVSEVEARFASPRGKASSKFKL